MACLCPGRESPARAGVLANGSLGVWTRASHANATLQGGEGTLGPQYHRPMNQPDSFDPDCGVCRKLKAATPDNILFQNELWHVCATDPPTGVPGWMMLITRRHVPGPAVFNDREAASFGPTLRHLQRVLLEVSGALRIYTAAMGESWPHFHAHMVPRYPTMPRGAKAWSVFDLQRAAAAHEIEPDEAVATRIAAAYAAALRAEPPPGA